MNEVVAERDRTVGSIIDRTDPRPCRYLAMVRNGARLFGDCQSPFERVVLQASILFSHFRFSALHQCNYRSV